MSATLGYLVLMVQSPFVRALQFLNKKGTDGEATNKTSVTFYNCRHLHVKDLYKFNLIMFKISPNTLDTESY